MKWRNRIAQGFSPGNRCVTEFALKGGPMRITLDCVPRPSLPVTLGVFEPFAPKTNGGDATDAHSDALSGRFHWGPDPGQKPWAILFRHFMAIYASHHHPTPPPSSIPTLHNSTTPLLHHSGTPPPILRLTECVLEIPTERSQVVALTSQLRGESGACRP